MQVRPASPVPLPQEARAGASTAPVAPPARQPRIQAAPTPNPAGGSAPASGPVLTPSTSVPTQGSREGRALDPQTPYENQRQHAIQTFDTAFNASGIVDRTGHVGRVPDSFLPHIDALGQATRDPDIRPHFQNFLGRLGERYQAIAHGQPAVPQTDPRYYGSREHIQYGREVDQYLHIGNPALAAMLNPSGGKIGNGNDEVIGLDNAPYALIHHGQDHDARGYAYNYHGAGPGYSPYLPDNPLTGQVEGVVHQVFTPTRRSDSEAEYR